MQHEFYHVSCTSHTNTEYPSIYLSIHVSHPSIQSTLSSLDSWLMFKPLIIYCTIEASSLILTSAIHAWTASAFGGMIIADRQDQFTGAAHSFLERNLIKMCMHIKSLLIMQNLKQEKKNSIFTDDLSRTVNKRKTYNDPFNHDYSKANEKCSYHFYCAMFTAIMGYSFSVYLLLRYASAAIIFDTCVVLCAANVCMGVYVCVFLFFFRSFSSFEFRFVVQLMSCEEYQIEDFVRN